jgi:hypothetical protein
MPSENAHWSQRTCRCCRPCYCVMNPCPWARVVFSTVRALIWNLRSKYRAVGAKVHGFKIPPVSVWDMTVVLTSRLNQSFILSSAFSSFCKIYFLIVYCKIDWFLGDLSTLFQLKMLHGVEWDGTTIMNDRYEMLEGRGATYFEEQFHPEFAWTDWQKLKELRQDRQLPGQDSIKDISRTLIYR